MVTQREEENKERTEWIYLREIITLFYKFTRFFIFFPFLSDEGPMLKTLDNTIRIGSTPTNLYFDLYLYSAYAAHYVYTKYKNVGVLPICMKVKSHVSSVGPSSKRKYVFAKGLRSKR